MEKFFVTFGLETKGKSGNILYPYWVEVFAVNKEIAIEVFKDGYSNEEVLPKGMWDFKIFSEDDWDDISYLSCLAQVFPNTQAMLDHWFFENKPLTA